jgi:hypothetical protein
MTNNEQCRICFENDTVEFLVAPCNCKGSAKFVHNECLKQWNELRPNNKNICNECCIEYERVYTLGLEKLDCFNKFNSISLHLPVLYIYTFHSIVFFLKTHYKINYMILYIPYQYIFHVLYFIKFVDVFLYIKNKKLYIKLWKSNNRLYLPLLHLYFLFLIPSTYCVAGVAANMCVYLYFYEHYEIVSIINNKSKLVYKNKPLLIH